MSMILLVTTTTEDGKSRGLAFDSTYSPQRIAELDEDARKDLARLLIGTARNALGETSRHNIPDDIVMMAEHVVMSSDLEFDSIDHLDDFMCAVAFGVKAERERIAPNLHLIRTFVNDMTERNWRDKRDYILQQVDRIRGEA